MIVALAVIAAISYGGADFFGGLAARRSPIAAVVLWTQIAGLAVLLLVLSFVRTTPTRADFILGAAGGVMAAGALSLLYRGLSIGTMGVVSPITAVLAALIPTLAGFLRGDRLSVLAGAGIAVALIAVVTVSASAGGDPLRARRGIPEALAAGVCFGLFFIVLARTSSGAGIAPLVATRLATIVVLAAGCALLRAPLRPARADAGIIVLGGALDIAANVLFVVAAHGGQLAIVAVLTSLYPASTVALAAILVHERLTPAQWIGVVLALAAVALITLAR